MPGPLVAVKAPKDYRAEIGVPVAASVPATTNPLGAKGCGEAGCAGALPSVMNALIDALSEYGITHIDMPATPERVWQAIRDAGYVLVTEGYMDVVALAQLGFPNAVATLGTACTTDHVQKLFRFTDSVVFSFDGDSAIRIDSTNSQERVLGIHR